MAGLHVPLSTLRRQPRGRPRMTRGRCGSLLLHRKGLAPSVSRRSPDAPSQCHQARAYRNIPSCESDESSVEEVRVLDPRHPLFGRSFRVIRRSPHRGGNFPPSYEVEHRNGSSLLIPIAVTEWHDSPNRRTILSIEALQDLLLVVDGFCSHGHESKRSVGDTAADGAAPDRRRGRRSPGGGPS